MPRFALSHKGKTYRVEARDTFEARQKLAKAMVAHSKKHDREPITYGEAWRVVSPSQGHVTVKRG